MSTVVLMWNPAISSYTINDYLDGMEHFGQYGLNWSVWEHERVEMYDCFVMVKVGEGKTGIVMSGMIISDPYKGDDWSGKGRDTHYVDLRISVMLHPEKAPLLTTEELMREIPDFDWTGGHSGRILTEEQGSKVKKLWELHQETTEGLFKDEELAQHDGLINDACDKLYCIEHLLRDYDYEVHTNADPDYDYLDDISYCITLKNAAGDEMFIDLEGEFTLTFQGWHTHYFCEQESYEELKEDIMAFLKNEIGAVTFMVNGKWFGDRITHKPIETKEQALETVTDMYKSQREFLRKIHRQGVEVCSRFWDTALNTTINIEPGEIPKKTPRKNPPTK